jgi:hypothetical protein
MAGAGLVVCADAHVKSVVRDYSTSTHY